MLPPIGFVESVEMIRDGGSLAAVFQGGDGCRYWLLLQILRHPPAFGNRKRSGYDDPVIVDRLTKMSIPVSWTQARILLNQIRLLVREERDLKWLACMDRVVAARGNLPLQSI